MNRFATTVSLITIFGALASGCADPDGIRAQGSVSLTVRQSGQPEGSTAFNLPPSTFIDAPPGLSTGFFGTCSRAAGRWTIELSRANVTDGGLRRIVLSAPEGTATGAVNIKLNLGASEFSGTTECSATAIPYGEKGVFFTAACANVRAAGDLRAVDATVRLSLEGCSVQ